MARQCALPRYLAVVLSGVLVVAVVAMHAVGMSMPSPMSAGMHDVTMKGAASSSNHPAIDASMAACAGTHCAAARGGEAVAAHATPSSTITLVSDATPSAGPAVIATATASRAPPRSGSCSPLCVWRQ